MILSRSDALHRLRDIRPQVTWPRSRHPVSHDLHVSVSWWRASKKTRKQTTRNKQQKPRINDDHKGTKIIYLNIPVNKQTKPSNQNKVNKECEIKTLRLVSVGLGCFQGWSFGTISKQISKNTQRAQRTQTKTGEQNKQEVQAIRKRRRQRFRTNTRAVPAQVSASAAALRAQLRHLGAPSPADSDQPQRGAGRFSAGVMR